MKKRVLALLMAVTVVMSLTACGGGSKDTKKDDTTQVTSQDPKKMVVGSPIEASSLDPAFNADFGSYQVLNQICQPVIDLDKEGNAIPGLATVEQTDDVTYVYTFREGVKFSDGTDLTAEDAVFSIADGEVSGDAPSFDL